MTGSYSFPRLDTPENEKKEKYHENFARAIVNRSIDDSWRNSWLLISECYKFLDEGSNGELVSHLQKAEDGTDLPAIWLSLNSIPTKIDLLTGELETRGYDIRVRAMNKEAVSRKHEQKETLRVKRRLQPLFNKVDKIAGLPTGESEYIPQTDQELDEYADLKIKDKVELIMTGALKWLVKRNNWDEERRALWRDLMASGRAWVENEIVRGLPVSSRVHPLEMIWDTSAKKDDLNDASYYGRLRYMPMASAAEKFGLTTKELEDLYSSHEQYMQMTPANQAVSSGPDYAYGFDTIGGKRLLWFKSVEGEMNVLVARTTWRDYKILKHKNEINKNNNSEHLQRLSDNSEATANVLSNKLEVWRECTIIGGHIIRNWGEAPNQPRSANDLGPTEAPFKAWIPNISSGRGVSKVEQLASIQLYKDVIMYNMQLAVIAAGAKGLSYDLAMKPDTMTIEQVMKYKKVFGFTVYNSKDFQYLPGSNTSPFKEYDSSISDSVVRYVEIMSYLDREMDKISGVSPERQGTVQGASQGLGVTQAALFQNNLITQPYFIGFERFCSRVLNHQAKLVKISWANKEIFSPIIGDVGVDFLREHIDLELEDFAAFTESVPPLIQDRAKLENFLTLAVQSDPSLIDDVLEIMLEPDLKTAVRKFQRKRALQKIYMAQQAEAQEKRAMLLEERLRQLDAQQQNNEIMGRLRETEMKNEAGMQKTLATGRQKSNSDRIGLMGDIILSEMDLRKQQQQQKNNNGKERKKTPPNR